MIETLQAGVSLVNLCNDLELYNDKRLDIFTIVESLSTSANWSISLKVNITVPN